MGGIAEYGGGYFRVWGGYCRVLVLLQSIAQGGMAGSVTAFVTDPATAAAAATRSPPSPLTLYQSVQRGEGETGVIT